MLGTNYWRSRLLLVLIAALWSWACVAADSQASADDIYCGNYRIDTDHFLGVDRFIMDDGTAALLLSDYSTGVVRRLFRVSDNRFVMGAGFNQASPAELHVDFVKDEHGQVRSATLRYADGASKLAPRVAQQSIEVSFDSKDAKLAGTLITPASPGPHPGIVLLHGSGPLTRYSFGPYPHFFASLGFAVLVYDKRGTGKSTGVRLDASTGPVEGVGFYPEALLNDASAALHFMQSQPQIDRKQIGFWGSSEGGMLALQLAARSKELAFAINSSGFVGQLWEPVRFQIPKVLRGNGASEDEIRQQMTLIDLWQQAASTGKGWDRFQAEKDKLAAKGISFFQAYRQHTDSLEEALWDWDHILSFDSSIALKHVNCPVLGLFGELDPLTNVAVTAPRMKNILESSGQTDFLVKVIPNAGHSLAEMPSHARMAPGVFETIKEWLRDHVDLPKPR